MSSTADAFFEKVRTGTEKYLTRRKALRQAKKNKKRTFFSEVLEWLDALVFAVVAVCLIHQLLFQLFIIPSPSMQNTLMVGDHVAVSKTAYGIELYPYGPKVGNYYTVRRDDIITFYNPEYSGKSPLYSMVTKLVFMCTLGLVNIDKTEWLLVKRAAGTEGDTVTFRNGEVFIRPSGTGEYVSESSFKTENGLELSRIRSVLDSTYVVFNAMATAEGMLDSGLQQNQIPSHLRADFSGYDSSAFFTDSWGYNKMQAAGKRMFNPADEEARSEWMRYNVGIYVPSGYVLPLGDNRDNSGDGRYFGPVPYSQLNGRVLAITWPLSRFGSVN